MNEAICVMFMKVPYVSVPKGTKRVVIIRDGEEFSFDLPGQNTNEKSGG